MEKEVNINEKENKNPKRIWEIDYLRGLMILLMIMDHFFYDFGYLIFMIFNVTNPPSWLTNLCDFSRYYWTLDVRIIIRMIVVSLFFVLSGISSYFSKHNLKRSLLILVVGVVITLGSYVASIVLDEPSAIMILSTLTTFGLSIFMYWLLHKVYSLIFKNHLNLWKYLYLIMGLTIVILGFCFKFYDPIDLAYPPSNIDEWVGLFTGKYYYGSDWMPLLPYMGYIFIGAFIGETVYKNKVSIMPAKLDNAFARPVNFVGRHSIYFYLLHQVVLVILMVIICLLSGLSLKNFI